MSVLVPAPIIPVIDPVPLFVTDSALRLAKVMAAALNVFVVIVNPVNGVPPTAPVKVVLPVVVVARVLAPLTVELNKIAPALLPVVKVAPPAPKVTAPV